MEPGQLVFALLSQAARVVALAGTRIYPLRIPQGQPRPAVAFQLISNTNDGIGPCRLNERARVQVSIYADSYAETCALSGAVRAVLDGYRDGETTVDFAQQLDHYDDPAACFFRSQDYEFDYPAA